MERTCGECVVCCVYPSIDQDGVTKQALTPCHKLIGGDKLMPPIVMEPGPKKDMPLFESKHYRLPGLNCSIYKTRPGCCSDYRCAWLNGYGDENDRPDKVGVVMDTISPAGVIENALIAKPLWFGAEDEKPALDAMMRMSHSAGVPVLVLQFTEFKLLRVIGKGV